MSIEAKIYQKKKTWAVDGSEKERLVWYIKWRSSRGDKWRRRSLGRDTTEYRARRIRAELIRELHAKAAPEMPDGAAVTDDIDWATLRDKYTDWAMLHVRPRTLENRLWALKHFETRCVSDTIGALNPDRIDEVSRAMLKDKCSAGTVNNALRSMKAMVNRAIKNGWYGADNPFVGISMLDAQQTRHDWLTREQAMGVLEAAQNKGRDVHIFCALGILAGLRHNEILNATWSWVDFDAGLIHAVNSDNFRMKHSKARTIPLQEDLASILRFYRNPNPTAFVVAPHKAPGKDRYRFNVRKSFASVMKNAGLVGDNGKTWVTPHTLRHTFASLLVSAGVGVFKVSQWLGHSDVRTTMIYAHLRPCDPDINRLMSEPDGDMAQSELQKSAQIDRPAGPNILEFPTNRGVHSQ